jgi:hypothetical protein
MKLILSALFILSLVGRPSRTLAAGAAISLAVEESTIGLELNVNYVWQMFDETFLKINYFDFFVYRGEPDSDYETERTTNGNEICRNKKNGQFADKENCDPPTRFRYQPSLEVNQSLNEKFDLGIGVKIENSGRDTPIFGAMALKIDSSNIVSFRVGDEYLSVGYGMLF